MVIFTNKSKKLKGLVFITLASSTSIATAKPVYLKCDLINVDGDYHSSSIKLDESQNIATVTRDHVGDTYTIKNAAFTANTVRFKYSDNSVLLASYEYEINRYDLSIAVRYSINIKNSVSEGVTGFFHGACKTFETRERKI